MFSCKNAAVAYTAAFFVLRRIQIIMGGAVALRRTASPHGPSACGHLWERFFAVAFMQRFVLTSNNPFNIITAIRIRQVCQRWYWLGNNQVRLFAYGYAA